MMQNLVSPVRSRQLRHTYLSNHAGRLADDAAHRYTTTASALADHETAVHNAEAGLTQLRRGKSWWRRIAGLSAKGEAAQVALVWDLRSRAERVRELAEAQYGQAQQTAAGAGGEDLLSGWLDALGDEWTAFHGYRNRAGEIDVVAVGPGGVWAIEVKYRNAIVYIDGDEWRYKKRDRRGNIVSGGKATDNGGRSWSRQVREPAANLEWWLGHHGHEVTVRTAVMLMHPRAEVRYCHNRTVNVVSTLNEGPDRLMKAMAKRRSLLDDSTVEAIAALITRDHRHHANKRRDKP